LFSRTKVPHAIGPGAHRGAARAAAAHGPAGIPVDGDGIRVDGDGIRVDVLRASGADAVIVTPSNQWPTGSLLSAQNRAAMIRWAPERGAVVIEDDFGYATVSERAITEGVARLAHDWREL
jgi:GntR family transcriptional regulator / MocR family aminotransferase